MEKKVPVEKKETCEAPNGQMPFDLNSMFAGSSAGGGANGMADIMKMFGPMMEGIMGGMKPPGGVGAGAGPAPAVPVVQSSNEETKTNGTVLKKEGKEGTTQKETESDVLSLIDEIRKAEPVS